MSRVSFPPDPACLLSEEEMPFRVGDEVDGHTITAVAAAGVMEVTYRAEDPEGREVALVCVRGQDALPDHELANEVRALTGLDGDHIVALRSARRLPGGFLLLVTELPVGETLRARMASGPMPPLDVARIGIGAARGLARGHRLGLLHRDVKPENLLFGDGGEIKLAAFGVAALRRPGPTRSLGKRYGTPEYAAPEQFAGTHPTGPWSDLYSLHVALYEALTGHHPLAKGPDKELPAPEGMGAAHTLWIPPPMESLLPALASCRDLQEVILRGLAKHPAERFWGTRRGLLLPPDRQDLLALDFAAALTALLPRLEATSPGKPAGPRGTQLLAPGTSPAPPPAAPAAGASAPAPPVPPARSSVKTAVFNSAGKVEGRPPAPAGQEESARPVPPARASVKTAVFNSAGKVEGAGQPPAPAGTSAGPPPARSSVKTAVFPPAGHVEASGPPSAPRPPQKTAALPPAGQVDAAGPASARRPALQTAVFPPDGKAPPPAAPPPRRDEPKAARPMPYPDELRTGDPDDDRAAAGWVRATREMTRGGHNFERDGLLTSLRLHPHPAVRAVCAEELGRLGDTKCIPDLRAQLAEEKHLLVIARLEGAILAIEQRAADEPPTSGRGPSSSRPPASVRPLAHGAMSAGADNAGAGDLDAFGDEAGAAPYDGAPRRSAYRNLWLGALVGLPVAAFLAFVALRWGPSPAGDPEGPSASAAPVAPSTPSVASAASGAPPPAGAASSSARMEPAASASAPATAAAPSGELSSGAPAASSGAPAPSAPVGPRPGAPKPLPPKPPKPPPTAKPTATTTPTQTPFVLPFGKSQD